MECRAFVIGAPARTRSARAAAAVLLLLALASPAMAGESPPESTAAKLLDALGGVRVSGERRAGPQESPGDTGKGHPGLERRIPALLLHEVRTSSAEPRADTLETVVAAGRMRVSYGHVRTILDIANDRFVLLDGLTATYRSIPFTDWEKEVRRSPAGPAAPDTLRFEAMEGTPVPIAGHPCSRWHLYARREVFPGEFEEVEQEIWVTRELQLPPGALETSKRVQQGLDWIGFGAPVVRPDGIALRTSMRRRPEAAKDAADLEVFETIDVEARDAPEAWFEIPADYIQADEAFEPDDGHDPGDTSSPR